VECERNRWNMIVTSGMTRNVRGSVEDSKNCERNRWNMRGSGEDQEKCERNRRQERMREEQEECERYKSNVTGPGGI